MRRLPSTGHTFTRLLYALVLVGGIALLAFGWYTRGADRDASAGRYVEGILGRPLHPSPLFARGNPPDADLAALLFSGLTRISADGTPVPDLAERWEVTPDGLAYTFHLRPDLRWHDGEQLDAADVAFTVSAVQAPGFAGAPALAARWSGVRVVTPDPQTVLMRLPAPAAGFLAQAALGIVPAHLLRSLSPAQLPDASRAASTVGSGPFRLVSLDATRAVLEPNASYHFGVPGLSGVVLRFYPDRDTLARAVSGGEVQAALLPEGADDALARAVAARPLLRPTPLVVGGYTALYLNNQRGILADPALRRALAASIDREALIAATGATPRALVGDGPIVPGTWAYSPGVWPRLDQADALFDAAGWPRGTDGIRAKSIARLRLELVTNADVEREELASAVANQLRPRGIEVTVRALPAGELLRDRIDPRDFDLLLFGWQTDVDPDPYGGWHTSQIGAGGRNIAGFHDADADRALEAARVTLDTAERREQYARFTARFIDQAPSVILQYPRRIYVQPRNLEGIAGGVLFDPADRFREVHRWRSEPSVGGRGR